MASYQERSPQLIDQVWPWVGSAILYCGVLALAWGVEFGSSRLYLSLSVYLLAEWIAIWLFDDFTSSWSRSRRAWTLAAASTVTGCATLLLVLHGDWWFITVALIWPAGVVISLAWRNRPRGRTTTRDLVRPNRDAGTRW